MNGTNSAVVTLARVLNITVTDNTLSVDLDDGRIVSGPIGWYPRLATCIGLTLTMTLASKGC
jgi:hypothetical protein